MFFVNSDNIKINTIGVKTMKKIRIGQIGIGHNHGEGKMKAVRKFPELFEVIGYAEDNDEWVEKRGKLDCYKDLKRMSVEEIIEQSDAVLVECDVWNLTKYAKKCIDSGKHIHMDKPASGTLEEYEELLNTAKEKNLVVQLGYMYRYNPAIKKCIELINSGELGEIFSINAEMSTRHPDTYREWLKHYKGGTMYIFGCHLIDIIISILGEPENVVSFIKQSGYNGVETDDNCFAVLDYKNATAKVTTASVEYNGWGRRQFVVCGSRGSVEIKPIEVPTIMTVSTSKNITNDYADCKEYIDVPETPSEIRYDEMMKDFASFIRGEKENPYTYEHEYTVQKVLYKIIGGSN